MPINRLTQNFEHYLLPCFAKNPRATLSGEDGEKSFDMIKLANLKGKACSE